MPAPKVVEEQKQKPEETKPVEKATEKAVEQPNIEEAHEMAPKAKTLPELLGSSTTSLLEALQGTIPAAKQAEIVRCQREMRIWYDAQPVADRKELARAARKTLEQFKMVAEQFFQEMMIISAQDVQ